MGEDFSGTSPAEGPQRRAGLAFQEKAQRYRKKEDEPDG